MAEYLKIILHILEHAVVDTAKLLPFLFVAYLIMEFVENKASQKIENAVKKVGSFGPAIGSVLGLFPQCGFSASVSNLFAAGLVSVGTVVSVFLATSDEAVVLLMSHSSGISEVWKLLLCKLVIALIAGFIVDAVLKIVKFKKKEIDLCEDCGCDEQSGIIRPAVYHTVKIAVFILVINLILGTALELFGEERIGEVLGGVGSAWYTPFITALIGFIPNCASSIIITELFLSGGLSFGAALSGLCSGAGIGIAVLLKANKSKRENFMILSVLYFVAVLSGMVLNLIGI